MTLYAHLSASSARLEEDRSDNSVERDRSAVARAFDYADTRRRISRDSRDEILPRQWRPIGQGQPHPVAGPADGEIGADRGARAAPHAARAHAVALLKHRVEAAKTLEPAGERDPGHGERGVGEQTLGQQEAMGLRQLDRGDAQLSLHRAAEMALAYTQLLRQLPDAMPVECSGRDAHRRGPGDPRNRIAEGPARRQLRAATQTGPEAVALGGRGGIEEPPALGIGDPRGADRTAVDPGRADADEEDAVEPGIA